ncbi:transformer 2 beta [Apophysomyces sp. BC1034]|nr:transformer 2 beta [Apophysomyces sp. BC1021]KAG0188710.1 transformer 2 beta [Apophysomyces sp. BC1034]
MLKEEFHGTRERPETSPILGVFGLSLRTVKEDLEDIFGKYGPLQKVTIVSDHRQNQSRGFGFVYFENQEDATRARDATNGLMVDNRKIRVDYSMTHKPHTPTPGFYMGEPREDFRRGFRRRRSRSRSYRRSQPSYRSRSRSLSR